MSEDLKTKCSPRVAVPPGALDSGDVEARAQQPQQGIELSVIVPTFNEIENVEELIRRVEAALTGVAWEMIFVDDDSPDGTADLVHAIARKDFRIRCLRRIGRRGLSSACIEGMMASSAPYVAVLDADLQHDESLLREMLRTMREENLEVVVGSRYLEGGSFGELAESRVFISKLATKVGRLVLRADLSDPMSGYFMIRRDAVYQAVRRLSGIGFKILLDFFASSPKPLRFKELPYEFRERHAGQSKLDTAAAWDYLLMLLDKLLGHVLPVRFISFSLVGGFGIFVHFLALTIAFQLMEVDFTLSQSVATLIAMTSNFFLNNLLTYRDMKLRGFGMLRGWLSFCMACSVGALANVGIAAFLFDHGFVWYLSALVGVVVGAVWNYAVTSLFTWKRTTTAKS